VVVRGCRHRSGSAGVGPLRCSDRRRHGHDVGRTDQTRSTDASSDARVESCQAAAAACATHRTDAEPKKLAARGGRTAKIFFFYTPTAFLMCCFILVVGLKVKLCTLDIAPLHESSPQKRSGMACVLKGSHSFTCRPTRSSAIGISHTCLCLPSYVAGTHLLTPEGWKAELTWDILLSDNDL